MLSRVTILACRVHLVSPGPSIHLCIVGATASHLGLPAGEESLAELLVRAGYAKVRGGSVYMLNRFRGFVTMHELCLRAPTRCWGYRVIELGGRGRRLGWR